MRRYYVISPNVWNDNNYASLLEEMIKGHFVLMGWPTEDEDGNINQKGKMFSDMEIGDCVIVAKRQNWKWSYCFMGTVDSESMKYKKAQQRSLKNFVDLRNTELTLLDDWTTNGSSQIPAIGEIRIEKNYELVTKLEAIIGDAEKESKMKNYIQLLKSTKNMILSGAPGTGKTYLAKQIAEEIVGKNHKENICFTQFHQSYDYTDFVEGLRPVKERSQIGFEFKNGTFKEFCIKALENMIDEEKTTDEIGLETRITNEYKLLCEDIRTGEETTVQLKNGKEAKLSRCNDTGTVLYVQPANSQIYEYAISLSKMLQLSTKYKKTSDVEKAKSMDFESYCPGLASYGWAVLRKLYQRMEKQTGNKVAVNKVERQNFVFIIDEINRGEMSKIFGELFYAIDPTCRITSENLKNKDFEAIRTQYSNMNTEANIFDSFFEKSEYGHFFVPENVFIIGTMNDIDRGVDSIDFAFRRRFAWEEVTAKDTQSEILSQIVPLEKYNISKEKISKLMDALNDKIYKDKDNCIEGLSPAYHLGAAYFLKIKDYVDIADDTSPYDKLWNYNLKPILREYLRGMDNDQNLLDDLHQTYTDEVNKN